MNTTTPVKPRKPSGPPRRPVLTSAEDASFWQRYRVIIIAVTLFIVIDLGVLVLNFYTSFQIGEDALGVNLSGRQRMLSQRMTKALLTLDIEQRDGKDGAAASEELGKAVALFDQTFKGFQSGATVPGGDGKLVFLKAAEGERARSALSQAADIWTPYQAALQPVLSKQATPAQLAAAVGFARANNVKLLGLMNDLTTALEANATERATNLRMVQAAGILLALLNFAYILYKFLSSLRRADRQILIANTENQEILDSVREGLCLVQADLTLGTQIAASLPTLLGRPVQAGDNLLDVLAPLLFQKDLDDARNYIELLFTPHVKENLVQSINPLSGVEIKFTNALGEQEPRHLSFSFNRVVRGGQVRHLLVTVQDISQRVALEHQIEEERGRARKEFTTLVQALKTDASVLRGFIERAESQLLQVNDLLRSVSETTTEAQVRKIIDKVFRLIHTFKGEATTLDLEVLAGMAHSFENSLQSLRDTQQLHAEALLKLPLPLDQLLEKVSTFRQLTPSLSSLATAQAASAPMSAVAAPTSTIVLPATDAPMHRLAALAHKVAQALGKEVATTVQIDGDDPTVTAGQHTQLRQQLEDMAIQLIRNAVVHGIETPTERQVKGKSAQGHVGVQLSLLPSGGATLKVRDDGAGLNAARIKAKLLALKWYTPEQLEQLSERQITSHIFKPGFSTADDISEHAGRGVGLDAVYAQVRELGGQIRVQTASGLGTEFVVSVA